MSTPSTATDAVYDLVIRGGTVVTPSATVVADVAVADGRIAAVGRHLPDGREEVPAHGLLVLPGGVDTHAHIEQISAGGLRTADDWESATRAAAIGGTTTVIAFAAQHRGMDLRDVVEDYRSRAAERAVIDYGFHLMIAEPTSPTLAEDLAAYIDEGHRSVKVFTTYDRLALTDEAILDLVAIAKAKGALVCVHAENHGMIAWSSKHLLAAGSVAPKFHAKAHPRLSEIEAIHRMICVAELMDHPIMIFHVSTIEGARLIREARGRGVKVFAETCPQYLFLTEADLDREGMEGAKWICSPPLRTTDDQDALWRALDLGDLQTVTSDHAPYAYDETGKFSAGPTPTFKQVASGVPGIELRLPLLFDAMVAGGRLGIQKFVELTATRPASLYGLAPRKGAIAIGADADIALWDADGTTIASDETVKDRTRFTAYPGRTLRGAVSAVYRRGERIVEGSACIAPAGSGELMLRRWPSA